ncbi:hypothetical protein B9Z55_012524 [Caenorhabditis nigoni]|uniref:Uncharacterized protein n=1 Tax=Caenorhabditis nigoni TaxID=1611254 RepID=A0A2G5TYM9_9PELO|nr:hypothetical protein B9Z55_012524 [Caenorhabditis nigoni]
MPSQSQLNQCTDPTQSCQVKSIEGIQSCQSSSSQCPSDQVIQQLRSTEPSPGNVGNPDQGSMVTQIMEAKEWIVTQIMEAWREQEDGGEHRNKPVYK